MKGVLLAGGTGSRLSPLTKVTNKHLLPIYDRPMVYYPLQTLRDLGVTKLLLVTGPDHAGHFNELLGSGAEFGMQVSYAIQNQAGGIAQALALAEDFIGQDRFVVMLGDNVILENLTEVANAFLSSSEKAHVLLTQVQETEHYGVARFEDESLVEIIEKPAKAPSSWIVTGCYFYTPEVFDLIRNLRPSSRGELEISDVNDHYVKNSQLGYSRLKDFWGDCGESIDGMLAVSNFMRDLRKGF